MLFDANHKNGVAFSQPSRRLMLQESVLGFGAVGLMSLLAEEGLLCADDDTSVHTGQSHFPATAKNVIFLFMSGGPSQVDTFDPKPLLTKLEGQAVPETIAARVPNIPRSGFKTDGVSVYVSKIRRERDSRVESVSSDGGAGG